MPDDNVSSSPPVITQELPDDKPLLVKLQDMWPHYWRLMPCGHTVQEPQISVRRRLDNSILIIRYQTRYEERSLRVDVAWPTENDTTPLSAIASAITMRAIDKLDGLIHTVAVTRIHHVKAPNLKT